MDAARRAQKAIDDSRRREVRWACQGGSRSASRRVVLRHIHGVEAPPPGQPRCRVAVRHRRHAARHFSIQQLRGRPGLSRTCDGSGRLPGYDVVAASSPCRDLSLFRRRAAIHRQAQAWVALLELMPSRCGAPTGSSSSRPVDPPAPGQDRHGLARRASSGSSGTPRPIA